METALGEKFVALFERSILCVKTDDEGNTWKNTGRSRLRDLINTMVPDHSSPINMVLPAFPFKSPNCSPQGKVLGILPDAGEDISLKKLEGFCRRVEEFHPAGAHIIIFSDGRVFNDLLGVSDQIVADYNKMCHEIVQRNKLTHLSFDNLENYVDKSVISGGTLIEEIAKNYMPHDFDVDAAIKGDLKSTYVGFRSFLTLDLARRWATAGPNGQPLSKKEIDTECKKIARQMIVRNQAFSSLVSAKYPNHLRLSIHAGNMQGPKWSISLVNTKPNSDYCASATPWHNVLCENSSGDVYAVRHYEVDLANYDLVVRDGQAWAFREKGARGQAGEDETKWCRVYTLANDEEKQCCAVPTINEDTPNNHNHTTNNHNGNLKQAFIFPPPTRIPDHILKVWQHLPVTFEFLKPFGVMIKVDKASSSPPPSLLTIPAESVRELACLFTTVVLRGFAHLSKEEYISGVERVGKLVVNPHGVITDVKEENNPKISVFTKESMPLHYDGLFKVKMDTSKDPPVPVSDVAFMQIFQCVEPPASTDDGGITTFIDTRRVLATFPPSEVEKWKHLNVGYYMPPAGMFGGQWMYSNIVDSHPITGHNILRIHEPWSTEKSEKFAIGAKATKAEEQQQIDEAFDKIMPLCFDDKFVYRHSWEREDILFADNHAQLHARTAYTTSNRHLRRIHVQD